MHAAHHRATALAGGHHRAAHRIPAVHEAERPGGIGCDAFYKVALRPDGGEIHPDTAALLHGLCGLTQVREYAIKAVGNRAHDKTVEQGHAARGSGPGEDSAAWDETEIGQGFFKSACPFFSQFRYFCFGNRAGYPLNHIIHRRVTSAAIIGIEAIFYVPNFTGERVAEFHSPSPEHLVSGEIIARAAQSFLIYINY